MRHSSLCKVQNEELNDKTKIRNPSEEQDANEEINANTLMLFYHPLFQETTKKFLAAIYQKQSNDIQIKFFQFIELNLRIQKALIETFQIEKAIVSALNDWNRELTLLNVQQHQLDQNGMKPFDWKYHYDSINELSMGASFSITNFAKLLENLKEHKSFFYSEYSISIEVFQKFLFDISCNWCQFYDIEIFCFFINAIFLQITKGQDFKFCQVKSLNQIFYLPQLFFKEFNQVKYIYSRYIKKNLKTNFKMWCEWNFQRLNDICQSLVIKLGRIFAQDQRTEEYSVIFKDALDNFNKEIIQSASKNQVKDSIENMIQHPHIQSNEAYATYMKGGKMRIKFTKQQRSMSESQKIEENQVDEDDKGSADNLEQLSHSKQFMEEGSKQLNNSSSQSPDSKKLQISNGQICLNEIENKIIQKKLRQINKILERQKNEIDQDSSSLKAAYRQAEKSNSNAFKYFQKLLRYKKEQQKKFIKNLPYGITSKSVVQQQQQGQQTGEGEKNTTYRQNQQNEIKNKQIIEDFYMCNQGKLNANQKFQLQDELLQQQGEFESNLKKQSLSNIDEDNFSFYEGKKRFLHGQPKKKSEQKVLQSQISNSNQSQNFQIASKNKQQSQNTSRSVVYSSQTPPIKNSSSREFSAEKQNKQNFNNDQSNQTTHVLDMHQIALSKAHQISPSRQNESTYDKNSLITPYRMSGYNTSKIQQQKIIQNNKLQPMNLNSNKVSESQLNSLKVSQYSSNQNQSNDYTNINNIETPKQNNDSNINYEVDKKQLTESKLYTTNSELDHSYIQQTRNSRIHSEQDYIFRNTSLDQKQPYNLFNKSLFNSSKNKKKISLGDIINLNYLYKPNLTFSGTQTNKSKQKDHQDLQIDIKSLNKFNQNTLLTERRGQGQKVRSQTIGLGEVLPQTATSNFNNDSKERQSEEKLNNSKVYLKPIQAQFTQKYRKLVSQSRYLWQKFLVEDDLYKINDQNKLNSFLDELKNTKNVDNIKQIIQKYTQNTKQPLINIETPLYQFKIPYNRKAELPLMQGKNMKLTNKM